MIIIIIFIKITTIENFLFFIYYKIMNPSDRIGLSIYL